MILSWSKVRFIITGFDNFHFLLEPLSSGACFLASLIFWNPRKLLINLILWRNMSSNHHFLWIYMILLFIILYFVLWKGKFPGVRDVEFDSEKVSDQGLVTFSKKSTNGPWIESGQELKPCWKESTLGRFTCELDNYLEFCVVFIPIYALTDILSILFVWYLFLYMHSLMH